MKVLIVDDDFVSRSLIQTVLKHSGIEDIDSVVSGSEAVEAFELAIKKSEAYDLIFLDMLMPHEDGFSALSKIRSLEESSGDRRAKIIVVTSLDSPSQQNRAFEEQCDLYLQKPVNQEKLTRAMSELALI